jgi:serine/threonine protein kinase
MLKHSNSKVHVQHAVLEKQIMTGMRHRNVVQLCYAFQTNSKLYMVLDLCPGGTLYVLMSNRILCYHHSRTVMITTAASQIRDLTRFKHVL